jgi:predicted HTH transcriptional regulator
LSTDRVGKESFAEKQAREKKEGKQKVLEMLTERGEVTNKDVEQTLGVSDATATRYLNELEKEGMAAQIGKSGPYVSYRRR